MQHFAQKTAFITGGGAGIGLGMAQAFVERGMRLALADIDEQPLRAARAQLEAQGAEVLTFTLDISDRAALRNAARATAERFGGIHVLCANAGVGGSFGPLQEAKDSDWDWIIDVNIRGTVNTVQAFLPALLEQPHDAHIVLTSSISGLRVHDPSRGQGMYNTTKYALVGLGEALALDLAPQGIGVSILCPGVVNTDLSNSGRNRPERYGGPFGTPSDFVLAKAASTGTEPLTFGRWIIRAIERQQLYVITHDQDRDQVEARHQRISAAFAACKDLTAT